MLSSRSFRPLSSIAPGAAVLLVLALAGCGGVSSAAPKGPTPNARDMRLSARISASAKAITIDYTLMNDGADMVVAFTGIPAKDSVAVAKVDPNAVYVTAEDGVVQLSKQVFAHEGEGPDPFLVRGVALVGGESMTEKVTVPLPLVSRTPYPASDSAKATLPSPVKSLRFCVGVALQNQLNPRQPDPSDSDTHLAYSHDSGTAGAQLLVCSQTAAMPS